MRGRGHLGRGGPIRVTSRLRPYEGVSVSTFQTLYDAHLTLGGHDITWREIVGNLFGLTSAFGGLRRRIWAWPVGIAGNVLLFTVFIGTALGATSGTHPLYGQAGRQVLFIAVSVWGWWRWQQNREHTSRAVVPRWASAGERLRLLGGGLVALFGCWALFDFIGAGWPAPWWYYLADSWIFVGSALATYAMARGYVDFWLCWIAVDAVGVPELLHFHFYPSAALYGVYGAFVIYGFVAWLRISRIEVATPGAVPRPDEVPA
ncbi:MAG: nicotinamide mononucleotide transporter [Frankiales bacterium]|jgi:nicotinamide mononucleotide transporter|nr:nicotinamide mononucleotide transporter [Frankiales bacterium]